MEPSSLTDVSTKLPSNNDFNCAQAYYAAKREAINKKAGQSKVSQTTVYCVGPLVLNFEFLSLTLNTCP